MFAIMAQNFSILCGEVALFFRTFILWNENYITIVL